MYDVDIGKLFLLIRLILSVYKYIIKDYIFICLSLLYFCNFCNMYYINLMLYYIILEVDRLKVKLKKRS